MRHTNCSCRTGRYRDAVLANVNAYNADLHFGGNCMQPYEPEHNTDMLIFAANMAGQASWIEVLLAFTTKS